MRLGQNVCESLSQRKKVSLLVGKLMTTAIAASKGMIQHDSGLPPILALERYLTST
jgi:hypothetical protein